jgi:hypothetical protein
VSDHDALLGSNDTAHKQTLVVMSLSGRVILEAKKKKDALLVTGRDVIVLSSVSKRQRGTER